VRAVHVIVAQLDLSTIADVGKIESKRIEYGIVNMSCRSDCPMIEIKPQKRKHKFVSL